MTPLINGTNYAWGDVIVNLTGVPLSGIKSINYSEEQDMEDMYGAGNYPVSRGYGRIKATGDLNLKSEEVESLAKAAPGGRLQAISPFDINVVFLGAGNVMRTHRLHNCQFKNNARSMNEGDLGFDIKLDLIISHITWNA